MISLKNIHKIYNGTDKRVLHGVDLEIPTGSFTVFIGPSGCGKSTILKIISGLEDATSGTVDVEGSVAVVFQNGALLPWLSVYDNVAFALLNSKFSKVEKDKKILEALGEIGLQDFKDKLPREISGGQRQRIGIARALVSDSEILILDEPFSALDIATIYQLHQDIVGIWQKTGKTIILVSHSLEEAVLLGQTIYLFDQGKIKTTFKNPSLYPRSEEDSAQISLMKTIKNALLN